MNQFENQFENLHETEHDARQQSTPTFWAAARDEFAARRSARADRRQLAADLAAYTTPADRNDLNAILDSYADADVAEIRELLNRPVAA